LTQAGRYGPSAGFLCGNQHRIVSDVWSADMRVVSPWLWDMDMDVDVDVKAQTTGGRPSATRGTEEQFMCLAKAYAIWSKCFSTPVNWRHQFR